jgi:hypothetical protein
VAVDLGGRTVAVPWQSLKVTPKGELRLGIPRSELVHAPTLKLAELDRTASTRR